MDKSSLKAIGFAAEQGYETQLTMEEAIGEMRERAWGRAVEAISNVGLSQKAWDYFKENSFEGIGMAAQIGASNAPYPISAAELSGKMGLMPLFTVIGAMEYQAMQELERSEEAKRGGNPGRELEADLGVWEAKGGQPLLDLQGEFVKQAFLEGYIEACAREDGGRFAAAVPAPEPMKEERKDFFSKMTRLFKRSEPIYTSPREILSKMPMPECAAEIQGEFGRVMERARPALARV